MNPRLKVLCVAGSALAVMLAALIAASSIDEASGLSVTLANDLSVDVIVNTCATDPLPTDVNQVTPIIAVPKSGRIGCSINDEDGHYLGCVEIDGKRLEGHSTHLQMSTLLNWKQQAVCEDLR